MELTKLFVDGVERSSGTTALKDAIDMSYKQIAFTLQSPFYLSMVPMLQDFFRQCIVSLQKTKWIGAPDVGSKDFQVLNTIGILRLAKEKGAECQFLVLDEEHMPSEDHQKLLQRYDIPIVREFSTVAPLKVGGSVLPTWYSWENDEPHRDLQVCYFGCPSFTSPSLTNLMYELFYWFDPDAFIDGHAYKYGITAMMGPLCFAFSRPIISINRSEKHYPGRDKAFACIKDQPWAKNITRVDWEAFGKPEELKLPYWPKRPLVFYNAHDINCFDKFIDSLEMHCQEFMLVMNYPSGMREAQIAMRENPNYSEPTIAYRPNESHWCDDGIFIFRKP